MMLRGYGEDDEQNYPLQESIPVPGQELAFAGPGVPPAALKLREDRELEVANALIQEAAQKAQAAPLEEA